MSYEWHVKGYIQGVLCELFEEKTIVNACTVWSDNILNGGI